MSETLLGEQVFEIVQELIGADYKKVGDEFFASRFARLSAAGWELGIEAYAQKMTRGRRGHALVTPKNEWRNVAHLYNPQQMVKVWYWNNSALSKADAVAQAERTPAPVGNYVTFNKSINQLTHHQ